MRFAALRFLGGGELNVMEGAKMRLVRSKGTMLFALALLGGMLLLSGGDGARIASATPGGTVKLPTKGVAWNAQEVAFNLDVQDLGTEDNCFADPSLAATGSGASVTFGGSTAADTSKSFASNALAGKPIYVESTDHFSGSSPSYSLTTLTDTSKNYGVNTLAGLTVTAANIFGSGAAVTYASNSLTDTSKNFTTDQLAGRTVSAGAGTALIASNTATTLTLSNITGSGPGVTYTSNTISDSSKAWPANGLVGRTVTSGAHVGTVASNTASSIVLSASWTGGTPVSGDAYSINTAWTGGTPFNGSLYSIATSTGAGVVVSNTATTMTIAGVWSPTTPPDGTSYTLTIPAGKVSGSGGSVTYTRSDTGAAGTAYTATTLTDPSKTWTPNEFAEVRVTVGGSTGVVASNTATVLTLSAAWSGGTPAGGSPYVIQASVRDTGLSLPVDALAGLPVTAIVPAITGSGGTVTYSSVTGTGGTVTYAAASLTDTSASFPTPNGLAGKTVYVDGATGVVQSNTATAVTLAAPWTPGTPTNGATYVIAHMTDTSKSLPVNSLAGRTIVSGSNTAIVHSNTTTTLTLQTAWSPSTPASGAAYTITPQADGGTVQSNTTNRLSLTGGWSPFTPPTGTVYYVGVSDLAGIIASNTATVMTLTAPWSPIVPLAGAAYQVVNSQPISSCGLGSYQTAITFDPTKLQYVSATNGAFLTSSGRSLFINPCEPTVTSTTVSFNCNTIGTTPLGPVGSGALATVRFMPLVGGPTGNTSITHTTTLTDIQGVTISHTDVNGVITFKRCADVSENGAVTLADVSLVLSFVGLTSSNDPMWAQHAKYDLNQNNAITLQDVSLALEQVGQMCTFIP